MKRKLDEGSGKERRVSARVAGEIADYLDSVDSISDTISEALELHMRREKSASEIIETRKRSKVKEINRFRIPVGDLVMYGIYYNPDKTPMYTYEPTEGYEHLATPKLWYVPKDLLDRVREMSEPFVEQGFELCIGIEGAGDTERPQVITDISDERGTVNGRFSVNFRGLQAEITDRLVWLEIVDPNKAMDLMDNRTDIPCVVRCDLYRYTEDEKYKQAFDRANTMVIEYLGTGKPMVTKHVPLSEKEELERIYGV